MGWAVIESLTVVTPSELVDRSAFNPSDVTNFERVTGIRHTRRWGQPAAELAMTALHHHKLTYGLDKDNIDALIVVTQSPDTKSPCMAVELHHSLGLPPDVPAFDINQSCDGFIYGLDMATRVADRKAIVVCVDKLRAREETLESLLFSDAASVAVIDSRYRHPSRAFYFTDGSKRGKLCADAEGYLRMDGAAVFDFVTREVPNFIKRYPGGVGDDWMLCQHQANLSMMRLVAKRSGFDGRCLSSIERWGNMSLVSIPAALADEEVRILGKTVLLCGYGAGFCAAEIALDWPRLRVAQILEV